VGVQEVRWDKEGTVRAEDYIFFYGKWNENHQPGTGYLAQHRRGSAAKWAQFVYDMMTYIVQWGRWYNIMVLNVHAPSREKSDDSRDSS